MSPSDLLEMLEGAIPRGAGVWLELGAGGGAFTRALVELLGPSGKVYAVDRDRRALAALERWAGPVATRVIPVVADFSGPLELPAIEEAALDGLLCANALHFVRDADLVLARRASRLRPGGRVVLVEYDRRRGDPWVPYPVPIARLPALAAAAGLTAFAVTDTRPSTFGGRLYVAVALRPDAA